MEHEVPIKQLYNDHRKHTKNLWFIVAFPDDLERQQMSGGFFYDFVFISSLTSCRHNRNPTRVTEALQHGITHQRYQHDFDTEIFALINQKKKFSRGKIKGGVVQEREISTTKKTQGKFVSQFPGFLFQLSDSWRDVNATETRTELREKFIREAFFQDFFPFHFVLHSSLQSRSGSCGMEVFSSSSSTMHNDIIHVNP